MALEDRIDRAEVSSVDGPTEGADVVLHLGNGTAADERRTDGGVGGDPAERELRETPAVSGGDALQLLHRSDVPREGLGAEQGVEELDRTHLRGARPPVIRAELHILGEC